MQNILLKKRLENLSIKEGRFIEDNIIHHLGREQLFRKENSDLKIILQTEKYLRKTKTSYKIPKVSRNKSAGRIKRPCRINYENETILSLKKQNKMLREKLKYTTTIAKEDKLSTKCLINNDLAKAKKTIKRYVFKVATWKKKFSELKKEINNTLGTIKAEIEEIREQNNNEKNRFFKSCSDILVKFITEFDLKQKTIFAELKETKEKACIKDRALSSFRNILRAQTRFK